MSQVPQPLDVTTPGSDVTVRNLSQGNETEPDAPIVPEYTASLQIWKYCPPVLLAVGTFGNVATIAVYKRMKWGGSAQPLFLIALAIADLCVLYSGLLPDITYHVFNFDLRGLHAFPCKTLTWMMYSSAGTSAWLLVAMTTQRAMSVTWPHRVTFHCSYRKSGITVFLIFVVVWGCQCHQLYGLIVHDSDVYLDGACGASVNYEDFWDNVWPWVDMSLFSLLPSFMLLVSNVALLRSLRRSASRFASCGTSTATEGRKRVASSMTVTLVIVSFTFLLFTFPINVSIILWHLTGEAIEDDAELTAKMDLAWAVTNILWYANSAVNFFLYCLSGSKFREDFLKLLTCSDAKQKVPTVSRSTNSRVPSSSAQQSSH
ncbi:hypothetical protein BaRGS_00010778 [Batillaria attramentaria]|uniref:G-protein coupled receptors family 1 profile domain-containing protein n=1 Tax=Batillaria attramentaria TaxID=370345 RepID=A0ABD0LFQ7_9CAEN